MINNIANINTKNTGPRIIIRRRKGSVANPQPAANLPLQQHDSVPAHHGQQQTWLSISSESISGNNITLFSLWMYHTLYNSIFINKN